MKNNPWFLLVGSGLEVKSSWVNEIKDVKLIRDHSSITASKRWVGGVRKWQFLMIYNTVNHQRGGWVGLKKSKTWWHNTWMVPYVTLDLPIGGVQVLRHHVFDIFRPTQLFDDLQYCKSSRIAIFWPHTPTSLMT